MPTKLFWQNSNGANSTINIYKSNTPIDPANPQTLLVKDLPGTINTYNDTATVIGDNVYYLVTVTENGITANSKVVNHKVTTDYGPGSDKIISGNSLMGYMGTVLATDLPINLPLYGSLATSLYKFIRNGKIQYTPGLTTGVTPATLIANKVFNTGVNSYNGTAAEQAFGEVITIQGRRYAPRIAKLYELSNTDVAAANYGNVEAALNPYGKSELMDYMNCFILSTDPIRRQIYSHNTHTAFNPLISCDFATSARTSVLSVSNASMSTLTTAATTLTSNCYCIPIIEYLGVA